jgi:hypothetical protein
MVPELPHELELLIFDFAVVDDDLAVAKALRLVNRECALRFARPVWFAGARNHYFNYLLRLGVHKRYHVVKLLCDARPRGMECVRRAAVLVAQATSEEIADDRDLFRRDVPRCPKYRI